MIAALLAVTSVTAYSQTVYIDDTLLVPLRAGKGTQYRILHQGLRSGTRLELLEQSDDGYSRVRTPQGLEGWVLTRHLTNQPIAAERLVTATRELEQSRTRVRELTTELTQLRNERNQLASSEQSLESRTARLSEELEQIRVISADALNLDRRNRELQESNQQLRNELEVLTAEKERLEAKRESDFMLIGAALILLGMLLAVIIPWLKPTKKHDNWA